MKFVTCEPLLEPVDLEPVINDLDWVTLGGEIGPNARVMKKDWVRDIRDLCKRYKKPFFYKQLGGEEKCTCCNAKGCRKLDGVFHNEMPKMFPVILVKEILNNYKFNISLTL